jgi:translation initiation factor IF-3
VPEVRVIGDEGAQFGILPTHEALRIAEEKGLDLVEVSPKAVPPVCKIMDYGRFKYDQSKKTKAARKHQSTVLLKEVKFRPKTDDHDFDFKVRHIRRFLQEGNKTRLVIAFRGREIVHPEVGNQVLNRVVQAVSDIAGVEQSPSMEGRRMVMIIAPRGGVIRPATTTTAVGAPAPAATAPPASAPPTAPGPRPPASTPPSGPGR